MNRTILEEIAAERDRQDTKWGEQNHPDGTGGAHAYRESIQRKEACDDAFKRGICTFAHILLEEVYEAIAEDDPARLRAELVQVASVAANWIQAIDRRLAGAGQSPEEAARLASSDSEAVP